MAPGSHEADFDETGRDLTTSATDEPLAGRYIAQIMEKRAYGGPDPGARHRMWRR